MTNKPIFENYQYSLTDNLNVPNNLSHSQVITEDILHRIETYSLKSFISTEDSILDIGCAEGMFCIHLAKLAKSTTGIDPIASHIETAKHYTQKYNLTNCNWIQQDFVTFCQNNNQQFNVVMCFAAHSYIIGTHKRCHWNDDKKMIISYEEFVNYMIQLTAPNGFIIIEGHPKSDPDHQDWEPLLEKLLPKVSLIRLQIGRPNRPLGIFQNDR